MPTLILASSSPRRRLLLAAAGYEFAVEAPHVDESPLPGEAADAMVARLAHDKAEAVIDRVDNGSVVLAVDTTVLLDGEVLGKPVDGADAADMLRRLAGRTHSVVSGFAAVVAGSGEARSGVAVTEVAIRELDDAEIAAYVATGESADKAGAYAFQGLGRRLVASVNGLKSNVVGLPLEPVVTALADLGVERRSRRL